LNDETKDYQPGETILIPLGAKHRMANPSETEDMILVEVQTGTYFGEDDIVRVQDDYSRDVKKIANVNYPPYDWTEET
jgi:mannose-6-phosphate isomerase